MPRYLKSSNREVGEQSVSQAAASSVTCSAVLEFSFGGFGCLELIRGTLNLLFASSDAKPSGDKGKQMAPHVLKSQNTLKNMRNITLLVNILGEPISMCTSVRTFIGVSHIHITTKCTVHHAFRAIMERVSGYWNLLGFNPPIGIFQ